MLFRSWGTAPKDARNPGPNEFNTVHSIQISKDRRLFVVDRGHRRIQVFDENGKFLDMWNTGLRSFPYAHVITQDQYLWTADGGTNRIVKYDLDGHFLYGWGAPGGLPGQFGGPHSMTIDQEGNLYIADLGNARVRLLSADGRIRTVAGGGDIPASESSEGSPATVLKLKSPRDVLADPAGGF